MSEIMENCTDGNITVVCSNSSAGQEIAEPTVWEVLWTNGKLEIPMYSVIFLLAVVGNSLVILTLGRNSQSRSNVNIFLLNLAVADLVLAVFCMPFTLIGTLLRNFIFGEVMCRLVPFLQATSVAASVWTLVALSIERYYAICHPLSSRKWQTHSHALRLILGIWTGSITIMIPILMTSEIQPTRKGRQKCRERWSNQDVEEAYNILLNVLLLIIPLIVLGTTFYLISSTLWKDMLDSSVTDSPQDIQKQTCLIERRVGSNHHESQFIHRYKGSERDREEQESHIMQDDEDEEYVSYERRSGLQEHVVQIKRNRSKTKSRIFEPDTGDTPLMIRRFSSLRGSSFSRNSTRQRTKRTDQCIALRQSNYKRSLLNKKRVIKMLFVVVLEFFICWTPLYVIHTLTLFWPQVVYDRVGYKTITFFHLLAYSSSCCNPITYCFMNKAFRTSFLSLFSVCKK